MSDIYPVQTPSAPLTPASPRKRGQREERVEER